jgi:antitoxin VapB
MPLSIKDPEADILARRLAEQTGETITKAVIHALREQLAREERKADDDDQLVEDILEIARRFSALPVLDPRSPDEILGYDENGLPT